MNHSLNNEIGLGIQNSMTMGATMRTANCLNAPCEQCDINQYLSRGLQTMATDMKGVSLSLPSSQLCNSIFVCKPKTPPHNLMRTEHAPEAKECCSS